MLYLTMKLFFKSIYDLILFKAFGILLFKAEYLIE